MENEKPELKPRRFAEKVRALMGAKGLTFAEIARRMGRDPNVVNRWVEKNQVPKLDGLFPMARILGVTIEYLIDDALDEPGTAGGGALKGDEEAILRLCRAYGLTLEEFGRLTRYQVVVRPEDAGHTPAAGGGGGAEPPAKASEGESEEKPRVIGEHKLKGEPGSKAEESKGKGNPGASGVEPEPDRMVDRGVDVPPTRPRRRR